MHKRTLTELVKLLETIQDGYNYKIQEKNDMYYVIVVNPDFEEDNGQNPYFCIAIPEE